MELIPGWAPNIHPILVHFPIGILLAAALLDMLNFFMPETWWDDPKSARISLRGNRFARCSQIYVVSNQCWLCCIIATLLLAMSYRGLCKTILLDKLGVIEILKSSHMAYMLRFQNFSGLDLD